MNVKEIDIDKNKKGLVIYITKDENKDEGVQKQIKELKKKYKYVSIFKSGTGSIEEAIKQIVITQRRVV